MIVIMKFIQIVKNITDMKDDQSIFFN